MVYGMSHHVRVGKCRTGNQMATAGADKVVKLWDPATGANIASLRVSPPPLHSSKFCAAPLGPLLSSVVLCDFAGVRTHKRNLSKIVKGTSLSESSKSIAQLVAASSCQLPRLPELSCSGLWKQAWKEAGGA